VRLPRPLFLLQRSLLHGVTYAVIGLVRSLPERAGYALGGGLARLAWNCMPRWRRTADTNLRLFYKHDALGEDTPEALRGRMKIARAAAINLGYHAIEFIRMGFLPVERALAMVVESEGEEHLRESLALGKGVVALGMHYGNWELAGAKLMTIHQLYAVGKEQRDTFFTNIAFPWRAKYGIENIMSADKVNSAILRALQDGNILGLIADQNGGRKGTFASFAGTRASTVLGPAALAMRHDAPLHLVYTHRIAPGKVQFIVRPRLRLDDVSGYDVATGRYTREALVECLERINALYEEVLREDPTQWLWGHPRWKTRPPGEPPLYN
jgi:KDO2-lipid IV(A) lauroyltransferase